MRLLWLRCLLKSPCKYLWSASACAKGDAVGTGLANVQVQAAFVQLAEANVRRPYMRDAVAEVSRACVALQANDAAPKSAGQMLMALRTEVTRVFVLCICSLMHTATSELVTDEDWEPVATVQHLSSPFAISSLPLRFQHLMVSALDHLTEYVPVQFPHVSKQ